MKTVVRAFLCLLCVATLWAQEKTWKPRLELSYVKTSGNTNTETFSGKLDVEGAGWGNRYFLRSAYILAKDGGEENANRLTSEVRLERVFTGRFFGFVGMNYSRDRFSGYDYRFSVGPGLGFDIIQKELHSLKGLISINYLCERYSVKEKQTNQFASVKNSISYQWTIKENVTFKSRAGCDFSLENSEKYFCFGEASLEVGISSNVSIGISYLLNYQNLPPASEIKNTDVSFLTSMILNL